MATSYLGLVLSLQLRVLVGLQESEVSEAVGHLETHNLLD